MSSFINELERIIKVVSTLGSLPINIFHKIVFCSFAKAGLSLFNATDAQKAELESLIEAIPPVFRGLLKGELYLSALKFTRSINLLLWEAKKLIIPEEANIHFILDFLRKNVGKVGGVIVLDCASIPEMVTIAGKFAHTNRNVVIYSRIFANPIGVTRFLTEQLTHLGREPALKRYAQLLKEELEASFSIKKSLIDLVVHEHGVSVSDFLNSLNMQEIIEQINHFMKQSSILITSDHGYDLVANEHGLYITHGYKRKCPLNFSRIALFLVID
ncbi:MAG: hypothetical protein NDP24_06340 [Crenarchaeota archaeon]|nr:hypothetical protein [Thermoproteota archaeon]